MPDYCSLNEALSLLPTIGTLRDTASGATATQPSLTQATALLAATSSEIDMHLRGQGATAPPTDNEALDALRTICMNGTAARIAKAKWPSASGPGAAPSAAEVYREDYLAGLAFIDAGGLAQDAPAATSSSFAHGFGDGTEVAEVPY
jgi:hypothetical protein